MSHRVRGISSRQHAQDAKRLTCNSEEKESRAQPWDTSQLRGKDPESLLTPTSVTTRLHPDSYWTQLNRKVFRSQERLHMSWNPQVLNTSYFSGDDNERWQISQHTNNKAWQSKWIWKDLFVFLHSLVNRLHPLLLIFSSSSPPLQEFDLRRSHKDYSIFSHSSEKNVFS